MSTNPQGAIVSKGLTDYAFQVLPDFNKILEQADFIAPRVITGAKKGDFAKFDTKQAFLEYAAQRAIGGPRRRIKFAGTTVSYNCKPVGLEIGLDDAEVESPDTKGKQEQSKIRTLLANYANSRFSRVWAYVTTSGKYTATSVSNAGKWSDANIDPINKLDLVIAEFANRSGVLPNRGLLSLDDWITLRNHPEVIKRQPGAANIGISLAQLQAMLCVPVDFKLCSTYIGTTGFGSSTDVKAAKSISRCLIWTGSDVPTVEDPSAFKTFQVNSSFFTNVMSYRDNTCASDIFYLDDMEDIQCASELLATLITIS